MSDQRTIEELRNRFEIHNLLEEYAWNVDHGKWREWAEIFTEDGIFRVWEENHVGREAILNQVEQTYGRLGFLRHHMMLPSIRFPEGGKARARLYFQLVGATSSGREVVGAGSYILDLVPGSHWQISRCEVLFDFFTRLDLGWGRVERGWTQQSGVQREP